MERDFARDFACFGLLAFCAPHYSKDLRHVYKRDVSVPK
jgi:hypothetical protein